MCFISCVAFCLGGTALTEWREARGRRRRRETKGPTSSAEQGTVWFLIVLHLTCSLHQESQGKVSQLTSELKLLTLKWQLRRSNTWKVVRFTEPNDMCVIHHREPPAVLTWWVTCSSDLCAVIVEDQVHINSCVLKAEEEMLVFVLFCFFFLSVRGDKGRAQLLKVQKASIDYFTQRRKERKKKKTASNEDKGWCRQK